jgi:hypothetical protein
MFLQEEYLRRHEITGVPVVNHISSGSLLLRHERGWTLMTIAWKDPRNHPGKYYINFNSPVHNGYLKNDFFVKRLEQDLEVEWDQFQDYLLVWSKEVQGTAIVGEIELALAAWEIFSFCVDGWLVEGADITFRKMHYSSVDLDLPLRDRYAAYQSALSYLGTNHPNMFMAFRNNVKGYLYNYCHWLGKLVQSAIA